MKVVIDRDLCNANLAFCQRCSAAFIRDPEGTDRLCIRDIVEDGKETLTLTMLTDGRILEMELTDEERDIASVEGWQELVDFDPALFRSGAMERWRLLRRLPAEHSSES
jgi:ferredoxin